MWKLRCSLTSDKCNRLGVIVTGIRGVVAGLCKSYPSLSSADLAWRWWPTLLFHVSLHAVHDQVA